MNYGNKEKSQADYSNQIGLKTKGIGQKWNSQLISLGPHDVNDIIFPNLVTEIFRTLYTIY